MFGEVIEGMEIIQRIADVRTVDDRPVSGQEVRVVDCGVIEQSASSRRSDVVSSPPRSHRHVENRSREKSEKKAKKEKKEKKEKKSKKEERESKKDRKHKKEEVRDEREHKRKRAESPERLVSKTVEVAVPLARPSTGDVVEPEHTAMKRLKSVIVAVFQVRVEEAGSDVADAEE